MKIAYITWRDHETTNAGWASIELEKIKPRIDVVQSVGFVLDETDDYYLLGANVDESSGNVNQTTVILKATIKEIIYVEDIRNWGPTRESRPSGTRSRTNRKALS